MDGLAAEMPRRRTREDQGHIRKPDLRPSSDADLQRGWPLRLKGCRASVACNADRAGDHETSCGSGVVGRAAARVVADCGIRHCDVVSMRTARPGVVNVSGIQHNPIIGMFHGHKGREIEFAGFSICLQRPLAMHFPGATDACCGGIIIDNAAQELGRRSLSLSAGAYRKDQNRDDTYHPRICFAVYKTPPGY